MQIILASTSVYKNTLFSRLGFEFTPIDPELDESLYPPLKTEALDQYASRLALLKAKSKKEKFSKHLIIGADQVLDFQGEIFGKPGSIGNNINQLKAYNGKSHFLHTAVAILTPNSEMTFCISTKMTMRELSDQSIENYVETEMALDCAGGYKIESKGIQLFESIESEDFTAIEGLPLIRLKTEIEKILRPQTN